MFYISKVLSNSSYEVTDTKDGVSEVVTYKQLVDYVYNGTVIEGTHYGSRSDLKTGGFWKVEPYSCTYTIKMKCGKCYTILLQLNNYKKEITGYLKSIDISHRDMCELIDFNNQTFRFNYGQILGFKTFVQKNQVLQTLMTERMQLANLLVQKETQYNALGMEIKEIRNRISSYNEKFSNAQGVWTKEQFRDYISKHLHERVEKYGFRLTEPDNVLIRESDLFLTYSKLVGRPRESALFMREYDGTLFLADDYDKTSEYKSIINSYHIVLPNCQLPFEEGIFLGDKYYGYQCWYTIHLESEVLTEDLAKRILALIG